MASRRTCVPAVVLALVCVIATGASGQIPPSAKSLLSKPLTAGTVALMVEHGSVPDVQIRLAEAVASNQPDVRAAAARVAFTLGLRGLAAPLAAALSNERVPWAAVEQHRALVNTGASEHDAAIFRAWELAGADRVSALALPYAGSRGPDAIAALERVRAAGAAIPVQAEYLVVASRGDARPIETLVAASLRDSHAQTLRAALAAAELARIPVGEDTILAGLDAARPAEIRVAMLWHVLGPARVPPRIQAAVEAFPATGGSTAASTDVFTTITLELANRLAGRAPRTDAAWQALLRAPHPDLGSWFLRPGTRSLLRVPEYETAALAAGTSSPLLPSGRGRGVLAPSQEPQTDSLRTAWGYPPGFVQSVFDATGCDVARAQRQGSGGGGGTLTLRSNGAVSNVALLDMGASRQCTDAVRALLITYVADPDALTAGSTQTVVIPFQPDFVACQNLDPVPATQQVGPNPPKKIRDVKPVYPQSAQADRRSGMVTMEVEIGQNGCIRRATVVRSSEQRFSWAAIRAVVGWGFTPVVVDGRATPVRMTVTTSFQLN